MISSFEFNNLKTDYYYYYLGINKHPFIRFDRLIILSHFKLDKDITTKI